MTLTRRIAHNAIIQIAGKIIGTVLGVIAIGLMTRYLGREGFGQYTTIIAFLQFFGIVIDFGLNVMTVQLISEGGNDDSRVISNIITIRLLSAVIFLGAAPLVVWLFPYPVIVKIGVAVTALSFFFIVLHQILMGVFQKHLRMDKIAIAEVLGRIFLVIGVGLAIYLDKGLLGIMIAVVVGSFINFFITYLFSLKYVKTRLSFDFLYWGQIMKRAWPIGLSIFFNLIYLKADIIILGLFRPQTEVGIYGAPYRVLEILIMFPIMFVGIILPILSSSWAQKNFEKFKSTLQKAFDFLSILAIPLVVGTMFLADDMMTLVAGNEFTISGDVLRILILATAIIFVGSLFGHAIVSVNKQKQMIWGYLSAAAVALVGYFIFIPVYGRFGAAWMTVVSELVVAIVAFIFVWRASKIFPSLIIPLKAVLASVIMGLFIFFLQGLVGLILILILAPVVYFIILYLIGGFSRQLVREIMTIK